MEKNCEFFMNQIIRLLKSETTMDSIKEYINPNFIDSNGNTIFHYFSEYSLEKFYNLNYEKEKNKLLKVDTYKEVLKEYKNQIPLYIEILEELNCDILATNKQNQTPLIYSIIQRNYLIAIALIKKTVEDLTVKEIYTIFKILINSGDCLKQECLDLLTYVLSLKNEKRKNIFDKDYLNKEDEITGLTPIITICKDYSENIYEKFNQILKMRISSYYEYDEKKTSIKSEFLNKALKESEKDISDFILLVFNPFLNNLISLGADINFIEKNRKSLPKSAFIYLMKYPPFEFISTFVKKNSIDVNYKDESGQTAFMHLINNRDSIIKISGKTYQEAFEFFLYNNEIDIGFTNNSGLTAFGLCLVKGYSQNALDIYVKQKFIKNINQFNSEILIYMIKYMDDPEGYEKISQFIIFFCYNLKYNIEENLYDLYSFSNIYDRNIFHYFCMYSSDFNTKLYIFKDFINQLIKAEVEIKKKDKYERNGLFYFFIDENEKIKENEPVAKLEYCLKNTSFGSDNLDDTDIYGNSLIFYAVQSRAYKSIKLLFDYGAFLDLTNNEGNTIYSTAVILGDYELFKYLYNLSKKINIKDKYGKKDDSIFLQKVFSSNQIISFQKKEKKVVEILLDFYKKMKEPLPDLPMFREELEKKVEENCMFINYENDSNNNNIKSVYKSNYTSLLDDNIISNLDKITKGKQIRTEENKNKKEFSINEPYYYKIVQKFLNKKNDSIPSINEEEKGVLLANNLFQYCKSQKYENFCRFMINKKYPLFSICNDLISLKNENELNYYLNQLLNEKDVTNFKNKENLTIFHIIAKIKNNFSFYKEEKNKKQNISKIFDHSGNTPLYYACENFNKAFIEYFTNYSFSSTDNSEDKVKYSLFIESKNDTSPLKALSLQLNNKDMNILKLVIDISINVKKVYIKDIIIVLNENYIPSYKDFFTLPYNENLNNEDYIRKIIGLYLYYKQELKGSFREEELKEYNSIYSKNKNFNFIFDILLKENIDKNYRDEEGKNLIHLIVEMKEEELQNLSLNKKDILNKALEEGIEFDINDYSGKFPIDYAYSNKDDEIINILTNEYNKRGLKVPDNKY